MHEAAKRMRPAMAAALALSILTLMACGHKRHKVKTARQPQSRHQPAVAVGTTEEGLASWYGVPYHGRPAANGEIYDMEKMVAAHRTMPFNTWLKVTNLNNGLSANVRVIDRGPFVRGRIIDVSKAAARQIQLIGPGVARVRLEVISAPADVPSEDFYAVQVGAFASYTNAEKMRAEFERRYGFAKIEVKQGRVPLYRVLVGKESTEAGAARIAAELSSGPDRVFVVRLDSQTPSYVPRASRAADTPSDRANASTKGQLP